MLNAKSRIEILKFAITPIVLFFALAASAEAQQPLKVSRIGFLTAIPASSISARMEAFRKGLRDLGYLEGKNIVIDHRDVDEKPDSLSTLAAELVRAKVDVIVTAGASATSRAKAATTSIPIIMAQDSDPVATGAVASLARPGGNITGLSTFAPAIAGKRLELLKEAVPKLSHVAVFGISTNPANTLALKEIERVAKALALKVQTLDIVDAKDIETAFRAADNEHAGAMLVLVSAVSLAQRSQILALALKSRLPIMYPQNEYVEDGGLMSYAPNYADLFHRAATYVDRILKGAKPGDLPVEQPTKFELVINLKTAKQIGLVIPPNVLARADKVIK
jgi:putative tryptophan/tyrosine transport system substrate-binding protein